ncbi:MAG TPA: GNAT family protein [Methylomusa anaerophila]|uniref:Spermidine N(1)-acetyltransferase n=1 Tax=Methylomusa anaerophila TaxID=1930071 RepID=A0A348AEN3_9FIRM|nr:GNAT family protein [Methylomusa anaerophila]BBB89531.1 spermidine N(1)-acetyltransferase [Methylomusa anaerophila]HML90099.1 GNAT family protein [Methylomusa anaerophila]
MVAIKGSRVLLRDFTHSDLDKMHGWMSDNEVMTFLPHRKTTVKDQTLVHLSESIQENFNPNRKLYFFAVVLGNGDIIGSAGFTVISRSETGGVANLGWVLAKDYWGKGYATEAARLLIDYCFNILGFHKVIARCDAQNKASERVMIRCGMIKEAEHKQHVYSNGTWRDRYEYAIFRDTEVI